MAENNGCLVVVVDLLKEVLGGEGKDVSREEETPYESRDYLLTRAERSLYGVLDNILDSNYIIFAKVRMSDVLKVRKGAEKWQSHFNRIQSKHVDFLLCDSDRVRPVCAIELDDSSHGKKRRRKRDKDVDAFFESAGLPLVRIPAQESYNTKRVYAALSEASGLEQ